MAAPPASPEFTPGRGAGPAGRGHRRLVRILVAVGIAVVLALAGGSLAAALLIYRYDQAVPRDVLLAPSARVHDPGQRAQVTGPLNLLLIGSDYRTWNPTMGQRSDTIILAHLPATLDRVYLISIPRDLWVRIPADPRTRFAGAEAKINAAFEYGGAGAGGTQLLSQTLTNLVGVRFDAAAVIDFNGLAKAVDVLGGVEYCVDTQTVSIHTGRVFPPGCRLMHGADAVDYLRQRGYADGDFTRQRHQQQFLKALLARVRSVGGLTSPLTMDALLRAVAGSLTVDTGALSLPDLVFTLRGLRPEALTGIKVPYTYDMVGDESVVRATDEAKALFAAVRSDTLAGWTASHARWVNKI
ncbi:MAG TPA: LCP family protein [Micromonosporaceae bacterium]